MEKLPESLAMGPVTLLVADLDRMLRFYHLGVGLEVLESNLDEYVLGHGAQKTLILKLASHLKFASKGQAGLFHTAFLFQTRSELASAISKVAQLYPSSFTGSADHLVSEAFYFDDPEGNGVELYWDKPREQWAWVSGRVKMDSLPLDPNRFLQQNYLENSPSASDIGHVHLSVGNLPQAMDFYVSTLGFELTTTFGNSAMFVSVGGYHHHMAMNIWRSRGAGVRQPTLGLGNMSLRLGEQDEVERLKQRLSNLGQEFADDGESLRLGDPWGNSVTIRA